MWAARSKCDETIAHRWIQMGNKYRGNDDASDAGEDDSSASDRDTGADPTHRDTADAVVQDAVREAAAATEAADDGPSDEEVLQDTFGGVSGFGAGKAAALASAGYSSEDDVRKARTEELQEVENIGAETADRIAREASPDGEHAPDPAVDIPRFRDDETAAELIEETNEDDGGFTFHTDLTPQAPGSADEWMVGMTADVQDEKVSKEDVIEVYEEYQEELRDYSGVRIGGYEHDDGGYAVEVTVAMTDRDEAYELGRELDQENIFNIGDFSMIETEGDGNSPIDSPEDLRSYLDNIDSRSEV